MAKKFKKNQPIRATLPTGRVVEGFYIEPYGENGHSFYVSEYDGMRGGKEVYRKVTYGVKDDFIDSIGEAKPTSDVPEKQYAAWIKRADILEERINVDKNELRSLSELKNNPVFEKLKRKIERNQKKLDAIEEKIKDYEDEEY